MDKAKKIRLYYGIALAVLTVVVGILYIVEVADIYYGVGYYDTDVVWEHLIVPLVFTGIWAGAIIAGFVLSVLFPVREKLRAIPDQKKTLARLKKRLPAKGEAEGFEEASRKVQYHERLRIVVWACALALCLAATIATLVYVFDPANYATGGDRTFNSNMLDLLKNVMPWVGVSLLGCMGATAYEGFSVKRELGYVKQAIASGDPLSVPAPKKPFITVSERADRISVLVARIAVAVIAVTFIILGAVNGNAGDILTKATNICMECIGLG